MLNSSAATNDLTADPQSMFNTSYEAHADPHYDLHKHVVDNPSFVRCDEGSWTTASSLEELPYVPDVLARSVYTPNDVQRGERDWLDHACPAQAMIYSCYYHEGHPEHKLPRDRAKRLELRRFHPSNAQCLPFLSSRFLNLIANRRVLLLGDSILSQLWQTLVCALHKISDIRTYINWGYAGKLVPNKVFYCPFGAEHCHVQGGDARIKSVNATLFNRVVSEYDQGVFDSILKDLRLTSEDIVIFNIGLHYPQMNYYRKHMESVMRHIASMNSATSPHFIFMETVPQHFNSTSGYFSPEVFAKTTTCGLLHAGTSTQEAMTLRMKRTDWHNHVLAQDMGKYLNGSFFGNTASSPQIGYMRVADAMYSQYDAHVDRTRFNYNLDRPDCTHYCIPSGVFNFFHTSLQNAIIDKLGRGIHNLVDFPDKTLLKGTGTRDCFVVMRGVKYAFTGAASFLSRGFSFDAVIAVPNMVLDDIPYGGTVEQAKWINSK